MPAKNRFSEIIASPFLPVLAALAAAFLGQYCMYSLKQIIPGLIIFAAAAAVFARAVRDLPIRTATVRPKTEKYLFTAMLAVAAFFRFYKINEIPAGCFADEAQNVFDAMNILIGHMPVYIGHSTHNAALFLYPAAALFNFAGSDALQLRCVSAFFGFLTVPAMYFLLRSALGTRAALAGGFMLAILRWHVNFSRIGYHAAFALFVFVLFLYFAWKAYTSRGALYFALAGLCLGLSQHTYQSARLIPVWLCLAGLFILLRNPVFLRDNAKKIAAAVLISVIAALPVIIFAVKNPSVFFQRQAEVSIFTKSAVEGTRAYHKLDETYGTPRLIMENTKKTLLMFNHEGDRNPRHNIPKQPVLDFIAGALGLLGLAALYRIKNASHLFFLSVFAVFIIPGFITIEAPQSLRLFFLIPCSIFFISAFTEFFMRAAETAGRRTLFAAAAVAVLLPVISGVNNFRLYFIKQAQNPFCWHEFSTDAWTAGMFFREKGRSWLPVAAVEKYKIRTFNLAAFGENSNMFVPFAVDSTLPLKKHGEKNLAYMLTPHYLPLVDAVFRKLYPRGEFLAFYNKYAPSWMTYFAFTVFDWDIKSGAGTGFEKNGLKFRRWLNSSFSGPPASEKITPAVFLDPDYGDLSYEWEGQIQVVTKGTHAFMLKSKGRSELYINGKKLIENRGFNRQPVTAQAVIELSPGFHDIKTRYSQSGIFAALELRWAEPGGREELVPVNALSYK